MKFEANFGEKREKSVNMIAESLPFRGRSRDESRREVSANLPI